MWILIKRVLNSGFNKGAIITSCRVYLYKQGINYVHSNFQAKILCPAYFQKKGLKAVNIKTPSS